ncbi:GAF domain-containing protein [Microbacterium sp. CIAB417]|uniref:GAF domain-containing protein n=1 Tax=Microbacterium sp. CIAB417 TaxID=2860287 RepID=UPI001FAC7C50|nr:GAF domain-containing protein [Microbacterium sp. CIAB417]
MPSPWSGPRDASPASRLLIERAQEEFVAGNLDDQRLLQVRPVVRESWERSLRGRVGADGLPPLSLVEDELERYRSAHPLAGAMDMIRELLIPGDPEDSGVLVVIGDHAGRLLWIDGDLRAQVMTGDLGLVAGADWSESAIGTTAPGIALTTGRSAQIHESEHYNRHVQAWSCSAAPVFDPETRRILGVIDISGGPETATPQARMLVDAAARVVEAELLVTRLRARAEERERPRPPRRSLGTRATLRVLGRDRAQLEVTGPENESIIEVSARHAEILLMLAVHGQGMSASALAEAVYGEGAPAETLRPEMVRLRRVLERVCPELVPESRPYRLRIPVETDAQTVVSLLDRGAHRVALTAYRGPVLPDSVAPGVEILRQSVRDALRQAMLTEASVDVLLSYADIPEGDDVEVLRLCLEMLPARSPRRAGLVARIERLEQQ